MIPYNSKESRFIKLHSHQFNKVIRKMFFDEFGVDVSRNDIVAVRKEILKHCPGCQEYCYFLKSQKFCTRQCSGKHREEKNFEDNNWEYLPEMLLLMKAWRVSA